MRPRPRQSSSGPAVTAAAVTATSNIGPCTALTARRGEQPELARVELQPLPLRERAADDGRGEQRAPDRDAKARAKAASARSPS